MSEILSSADVQSRLEDLCDVDGLNKAKKAREVYAVMEMLAEQNAALRSENERLREALLSLARIETDEEGLPVLVISCGFHCQTSDQTELPLVWAVLAEVDREG